MPDLVSLPERRVPVVASCEVLVVGGGSAGLSAAVAAARQGADVVLVERYGYLGGLASGGLIVLPGPSRDEGDPPCVATGEAAGVAAVQALRAGRPVQAIDVSALQRELRRTGAWLPDGIANPA